MLKATVCTGKDMNYKQIIYVSLISLLTIAFILIIFVFLPSNNLHNPESAETTIRYVSHISNAQLKIIDNFNEKFKGRIKVEHPWLFHM